MNKKLLPLLLCLFLLLAGCSSKAKTTTDGQKWQEDWTMVGTTVGIEVPKPFTLFETNETLAADGLYYATWVIGNSIPYENSDGDTVDLYDAQLYFLSSEALNEDSAKSNYDSWLAAAKENYEVHAEDSITLNGQTYTLLTYDCIDKDSPYDRGVSAFGVCGTTAVCAEFTCRENYAEDLETLLTAFLDGCHFKAS